MAARGTRPWGPVQLSRHISPWKVFTAMQAMALLVQLPCYLASRTEERLLMGMQSSSLTAGVAYNLHAPSFYKPHSVSLHIILPSVGRETIFRMLDSLEPQLKDQDYVTVVFDGQDRHGVFERVQEALALMPGTNEVIMAENANDYGHTHRNNHMSKAGEFVMFADDDNYYTADALATVRAAVQHDPDGLFIFQLEKVGSGERIPSPGNGEVEGGNVDTGCGVVPTQYAHHGRWESAFGGYGADGVYFGAMAAFLPRTYMFNKVIYCYTGAHMGGEV